MKIIFIGLAAVAVAAAAGGAGAQQRSPAYGPRVTQPGTAGQYYGGSWGGRHRHGKHHGGFLPGFIVVERPFDYAQDRKVPVVVEREVVVREVVKEVAPKPPPPPRKPYVVGASYASLPPGGCMKMIEGSASYYYCGGGEWYRPVGKQYRAVAKP